MKVVKEFARFFVFMAVWSSSCLIADYLLHLSTPIAMMIGYFAASIGFWLGDALIPA